MHNAAYHQVVINFRIWDPEKISTEVSLPFPFSPSDIHQQCCARNSASRHGDNSHLAARSHLKLRAWHRAGRYLHLHLSRLILHHLQERYI